MFRPPIMLRSTPLATLLRAPLLRGGLLGLLLAAPALAQGGRPDQVFVEGAKRKEIGTVIKNDLDEVVIDRDGKERRVEAARVERIIWGQSSTAFRDGQADFARGDYENAALKFTTAASEDERDVVKAVARRMAGESLLRLGARDASQFQAAVDAFEGYLSAYPGSRDVPLVRALQARATWLRGNEGDAAKAGALYRSLFEAGTGATPEAGFDRLASLEAGVHAMHALVAASDTLGAREIRGVMTSELNSMRSAVVEEDDPILLRLDALAAEAQLVEGYVLLAGGQAQQAETFFNSQLAGAQDGPSALRFGARHGLGMAQAAQGNHREACIHLATVASIDFTSRDRTASALLELAKSMLVLEDAGAAQEARKRLTLVAESFGDTPYAAEARKML
jgi:TolA-binding protein